MARAKEGKLGGMRWGDIRQSSSALDEWMAHAEPEPEPAGAQQSRARQCRARQRHAMPCHAMLFFFMPFLFMPCHAMPSHAMPCHAGAAKGFGRPHLQAPPGAPGWNDPG